LIIIRKQNRKGVWNLTNTEMLQQKIEKSGLKLQFIADQMGISRFALYQKIRNDADFRVPEVVKLCELLGITDMAEREAIFFAH